MEKGLILVDRWAEGSQAYLLTYLHADHTNGLTSAWDKAPIFCSHITSKLFPFKFPYFKLSLLRALDLGSWHSLSLLFPLLLGQKLQPRCSYVLVRGEFGYVLNTGDFRWEKNSEGAKLGRKMLLNALKGDVVNVLYLDNTYCNPSPEFPSREVAPQQFGRLQFVYTDHELRSLTSLLPIQNMTSSLVLTPWAKKIFCFTSQMP